MRIKTTGYENSNRAWGKLFAVLAAILLQACLPGGEPVEREIRGNATFSADGGRVLQLAVVYTTTNPDAPYFNDDSARELALRFRVSDDDLQRDVQDFSLPLGGGEGVGVDFSVLSRPLWFRPEQDLALFYLHDALRVQALQSGGQQSLRIPDSALPGLFAGQVETSQGLLLDFVPAPDASCIAAFYRLTVQDADNPLILHFYDVIAFFSFDLDATFLGALDLTPWQGDDEVLRLDPPLPGEDPGQPAPGELLPINSRRSLVRPHYLLWSDDSQAIFIVDRGTEPGEQNRVAMISGFSSSTSPTLVLLDQDAQIPAQPIATRGGGVRDDGLGLFAVEEPEDPASAHIDTGDIDPWSGFAGRGQVLVESLNYGF